MFTSGKKYFFSCFKLIIYDRDAGGDVSGYAAIAVIEFQGTLTRAGASQGHYICDIKNKETNLWFRTNDNRDPIQISTNQVSKKPYAVLFKRM